MKKILAYSFLYLALFGFLYSFSNDVDAQSVSLVEYKPGAQITISESQVKMNVPVMNSSPNEFYAFVEIFSNKRNYTSGMSPSNSSASTRFYARDITNSDGTITRLHFSYGQDKQLQSDDHAIAAQTFDNNGTLLSLYIADGLSTQRINAPDKVVFAQNASELFYKEIAIKTGTDYAYVSESMKQQQKSAQDNPVVVLNRVVSEILDRKCRQQNGDPTQVNDGFKEGYQGFIIQNNLSNNCASYEKYIREVIDKAKNNPLALTSKERNQLISEGVLNKDGSYNKNLANSGANKMASAINTETAKGVEPPKPASNPEFAGLGICVQMISEAVTPSGKDGSAHIEGCMASLANMALVVVTEPFSWSANLLDKVTRISVTDFGAWFSKGGPLYEPVNNIWQLIKNICNLFFIVALIYIAVKTILQADGFQEKQRLMNVIIFAFLINFSMFFTKVMIDVSNTASLQVFNVITKSSVVEKVDKGATGGSVTKNTLADVFLANMQIQKFVAGGGGKNDYTTMDLGSIVIKSLFSTIFILVATVVIAAIAGMITIRFVMLVFLLMTSPIAYIGSFVPPVIGTYSEMWWKKFKENLIFLPVLMIMFYITMNFSQFASSQIGSGDYVSLIFSYVITIAMLVISLSVAQMTGGSAAGTKFGTAITAGLFARGARRIVGGGLGAMLNNKTTRGLAASNNVFSRIAGRALVNTGNKAQKATFDVRNTAIGKKIGLGDGLKGGIGDIKKAQEKVHQDALKAYKADIELSEDEKIEKATSDNYANATKAAEEAQVNLGNLETQRLDVEARIGEAEIKLNSEEKKIEAEMDTKYEAQKKALEDERTQLEAKMAATSDAKTKEDYKQKIEKNQKDTEVFSRTKSDEISKLKEERLSDRRQAIKELADEKKDISNKATNSGKAYNTAREKVDKAKKQLTDMGYDTSDAAIKSMLERNKELGNKETKGNNEFFKYLESGTSTFGGSLNGRNDAYKKEFLKQLRDKMKDKDSKDFEKLMKEAMNSEKAKEEKPEEGGDGKKK